MYKSAKQNIQKEKKRRANLTAIGCVRSPFWGLFYSVYAIAAASICAVCARVRCAVGVI